MDGKNEDYDSFEQYSHNRDAYKQIRGRVADELDSFPKYIIAEPTNNDVFISMECLRLRKYLMNFGTKENCKQKNCCQYIKYLLNKSVRSDYKLNTSSFDIYKSYMNHENNNNNNNEIMNFCLPKIYYMDVGKYNKIDKLYAAYEKCQSFISNKGNTNSCLHAKICERAYNDIINPIYTNTGDTKFCKILKVLKDFLEGYEPQSTGDCNSRFS
ncbi:hypothetical protein PCYB_003300, partial [Plasmodium cynomolgi strain B]